MVGKIKIFAKHCAYRFLGKSLKTGIDPLEPQTKQFQVRFNDLDMNLHMTNSRYNQKLDAVLVGFLMDSGLWEYLFSNKSNPHVMATYIRFRKGFAWKDKYDLSVEIIGLSDTWMFFEFKFIKDDFIYCQALRKFAFHKKGKGFLSPKKVFEEIGYPDLKITSPDFIEQWLKTESLWVKKTRSL